MPKLIKMYIRNVLIGFAIAAAFVAMLLWFNVMNLWSLVTGSDMGVLAVAILWISHGIVFAGVQFAWAVMSMAEKDEGPRGGNRVRVDYSRPAPVRVAAEQAPSRRVIR